LPPEKGRRRTAIVVRAKLQVLKVKRALKGVQLEPAASELDKRQARLREGQGLSLVDWRKVFETVTMVASPREHESEMEMGALGQQEGSARRSGR
jgi:hypothetical protein